MTDLDRLLELHTNCMTTDNMDKEYDYLKSKIEQSLESGIECARNCANMAVRNGELEQKLEQIEDWYSRIQGKVSHDEALEMIEILRGKEE